MIAAETRGIATKQGFAQNKRMKTSAFSPLNKPAEPPNDKNSPYTYTIYFPSILRNIGTDRHLTGQFG